MLERSRACARWRWLARVCTANEGRFRLNVDSPYGEPGPSLASIPGPHRHRIYDRREEAGPL